MTRTLFNILLERIMTDALDDHILTHKIRGRIKTIAGGKGEGGRRERRTDNVEE